MDAAPSSTKTPSWPYQGSLLIEISMGSLLRRRRSSSRRGRRRRRFRVLRRRADRKAHEIAVWPLVYRAVDDLDRLLEPRARLEVRNEIRQRRQRRGPSLEREIRAALEQAEKPEAVRDRLAQLVEHVDGSVLPVAQLFDQRHALLKLRLPRLELLDLREDAAKLVRL